MNRIQRKFVLDAMDCEDKLTEWEANFINSLSELDEHNPEAKLSDKQNEILNKIQHKILE